MVLMAAVCATIIGGGLMGCTGVANSSGIKAVLTAVPYQLGGNIGISYEAGAMIATMRTVLVLLVMMLLDVMLG